MVEGSAGSDIGLNMRRARSAAGLTQKAVAEAAGLSRAAYRSLEAGTSEPRARTVLALASALHVKPADLLRLALPLPRARFRSLKRLNERETLLARVARELDDYVGLENALGTRVEYQLGDLETTAVTDETGVEDLARRVRDRLGLGTREPVRDIAGLLEDRAGIKVLRLPVATNAFFGLSVRGDGLGPAVVVNTWDRISVERWIFTVAHELGHLLLHLVDFDPQEASEHDGSEREANVFAGYFLMPAEAFAAEWENTQGLGLYDRVIAVKRMFRVSYKTVLYRLQKEERVANVWPRFQLDARARTGRTLSKSDEPAALDRNEFGYGNPEPRKGREPSGLTFDDFIPDRRYQLVRAAVESGRISLGRAAEILGVPLRAMRTLSSSWV